MVLQLYLNEVEVNRLGTGMLNYNASHTAGAAYRILPRWGYSPYNGFYYCSIVLEWQF